MPPIYQHRVLFWGILGAVVMRGILIAGAGFLLDRLHWMIYVFGAFLIFTGYRFLRGGDHVADVSDNRLVNFAKRFMPVTETYEGQSFFTRRNGVRYMTPLFLVLLLIESTDLIFAVDSIPAIYAVTDDPFIVFTSNAFAILGLRSLFFVLSGYLSGLVYLKPALAAIMAFVGTKMVLIDVIKIPAAGQPRRDRGHSDDCYSRVLAGQVQRAGQPRQSRSGRRRASTLSAARRISAGASMQRRPPSPAAVVPSPYETPSAGVVKGLCALWCRGASVARNPPTPPCRSEP